MKRQRNSPFFLRAILPSFGLLIALIPTSAIAAASQDICAAPRIEFAPLEPTQLTWWTGRKQTTQMLEDGVAIADVALRYMDLSLDFDTSRTTEVVTIGDQEFRYSPAGGAKDAVIWSN